MRVFNSTKHKLRVGSSQVDKASIKNIWANKNQAWKGIDSILPTGGRYAYEIDHQHTADQSHMLQYRESIPLEMSSLDTPTRGRDVFEVRF